MTEHPANEAEGKRRFGRLVLDQTDHEFLRRLGGGAVTGFVRIVVPAIVAVPLFLTSWSSYMPAGNRAITSRVRTDMRSIGAAIEAYYDDHDAYPPGTRYFGPAPSVLTTPFPYVTSLPVDPFALRRAMPDRGGFGMFVWHGSLGLMVGGAVFLFGACFRFLWGRRPKRYGAILTGGYLGLTWGLAGALTGWAVRGAAGGAESLHVMLFYPPNAFGFIALAYVCLLFGSGVGKSMRDAERWRLPLPLQAGILAVGFGILLGARAVDDWGAQSLAGPAPTPGMPESSFRYTTDGRELWILYSSGPDGRDDSIDVLPSAMLEGRPRSQIIPLFLPRTYDPTNGTVSRGDIWCMKQ